MSIRKAEADLFAAAGRHSPRLPTRKVLIALGPPGSGKTTLSAALAAEAWLQPAAAYKERPDANPYLQAKAELSKFDFASSQDWFLSQYAGFCADMPRDVSVVIDQDPRAVVLVYSKLFLDRGYMPEARYRQQLRSCLAVLNEIQKDRPTIRLLMLRSPRNVLLERVALREGSVAFAEHLMDALLPRFEMLFANLKERYPDHSMEFDTGELSQEQIILSVKQSLLP